MDLQEEDSTQMEAIDINREIELTSQKKTDKLHAHPHSFLRWLNEAIRCRA